MHNEEEFNRFVLEYSQEPNAGRRQKINDKIWRHFGKKKAVMISDMSGFTVLTERYGPVHYLSMIRRMQMTMKPIIESFNGTVVKFEADNCFAYFETPRDAVQAAISFNLAFNAANTLTPDELDISISTGIDYGDILLLEKEDMFGQAVNIASKLGEDIADSGDILVTDDVMALIPKEAGINATTFKHSISKVEIKGFKIVYN